MQTPTFLQKTRPGLKGWSSIWAVVAIMLTLFSGKALAQTAGTSTATIRNVIVTSGTTSSSATTNTYDAISSTAGPNNFAQRNFGSFDVNSGVLLLQGGTVQITEMNGEVYNRAFIQYAVAPGTLTSANPALSQTIELTQSNYDSGTGVRTFSLSSAARNILAAATVGGAANGSNRFDVQVSASGNVPDGNGGFDDVALTGARRRSVFTATGTPSTATVSPNNIQLAADGATTSTSYYFPNTGTTPQFPGYNFCSNQNAGGTTCAFNINNGQLRLTNTSVTTTETGANTVSSVVLYYRVRSTSSGGGAFQPITLSQSGTTNNGSRTFIIDPSNANNTNPQPNLIAAAAVTTTGTYAIDVYYQASGVNSSTGSPFTVTYPPTGYSTATFTVGGTPIAVTIWTGAINDNWFDSGNWTNGIPNSTTNALVRDLGVGNNVPYPNIRSDYRYTTAGGALIYDNTGSGPAQALNFTMGGSSQASRSIARLVNGQLRVFGTFDNSFDSFIQRENTIMEFAGGDQSITGGSFVRVDISGGGTKMLQGVMNISEALSFLTPNVYAASANPLATNPYTTLAVNAGVLATDITQPSTNVIVLADRASTNYNNGAQLNGENDPSFVYGFVRTTRQAVLVGEARTYGNIGMDLTFTGANSPGNVDVTRNTVEAYNPVNNVYGVRRIFGVRPSDQATNSGGLQATMVFHYRNAETKRLNGPDTRTYGTSRIAEQNLIIFVSTNSGNTFQRVGRDAGSPDTVRNTVTRTGVTTFATFTLGDITNPLPVKLVAFNAVRSGSAALLSWTTATEENNRGFNVQSSSDGVNYTTLSFVASKLVNSLQSLNYTYTDAGDGKVGTRYYRLEQVDLDGKTSYSPVRVVSFDGKAAGSLALAAYPNPFTNTVDLTLEGATGTEGTAQVKLMDMTGRLVRDQQVAIVGASLSLGDLSDLQGGLYQVKVLLPDGTAKTVRVQKQ